MRKIGLKQLYKDYPYKCQIITTNTVPVPYIKQEDQDCDSRYSISYRDYVTIIRAYAKIVLQYLLNGATLKLPHRMGNLCLELLTNSYYKDFQQTTKGNVVKSKSTKLGGDSILLRWYRKKKSESVMTNKWKWRIRLTKNAWLTCVDKIRNDRAIRNNLKKCKKYN